MKALFKIILKYYLKYITKLAIFVHQPVIVVIAGSINKSFFKDEIKKVLEEEGILVRANEKSFNTEIGLPLAILSLPSGYNSYRNWLPVLWLGFLSIFKKNFPKVLVLELGVSRPGDMKYLLSLISPKVSIITDITQRYLESFSDIDDLFLEYGVLVKKTRRDGLIILNCDNMRLRRIVKMARVKVETFGTSQEAGWRIQMVKKTETGQEFEIRHAEKTIHKKIERFGQHNILASATGEIVRNSLSLMGKS